MHNRDMFVSAFVNKKLFPLGQLLLNIYLYIFQITINHKNLLTHYYLNTTKSRRVLKVESEIDKF